MAALCSRDKELLRDTINPVIGVRTSQAEAKRWRNSVSNDIPPSTATWILKYSTSFLAKDFVDNAFALLQNFALTRWEGREVFVV